MNIAKVEKEVAKIISHLPFEEREILLLAKERCWNRLGFWSLVLNSAGWAWTDIFELFELKEFHGWSTELLKSVTERARRRVIFVRWAQEVRVLSRV